MSLSVKLNYLIGNLIVSDWQQKDQLKLSLTGTYFIKD